jgi:hypothetical protein
VLGGELVEPDVSELGRYPLDLEPVASYVVGERVGVMWSSQRSGNSPRVVGPQKGRVTISGLGC